MNTSPAPTPLILDTGLLLSLAVDDHITGRLKARWKARGQALVVPAEVWSELQSARRPGYTGQIPKHLVRSAVNKATFLAGSPTELDTAQLQQAKVNFHDLLGAENDPRHWGEAAAAQLARDNGGVVVLEDLAARRVLASLVPCFGLWELLHSSMADGTLSEADVDAFITKLQANDRPNFHRYTAADVAAHPQHPSL